MFTACATMKSVCQTEKSKSAQNLSRKALGSAQPFVPMFRLGPCQEEHERIREEVIDLKITERLSVTQVV